MATQLAHQENRGMTLAEAVNGFRGQLEARAREFQMVLPAHITPEKLQRTILTAVQSDPDLLRADRQSLILACMKAAQDGLLPDKREAALVIFNENKKVGNEWVQRKLVQYMPMVFGLRKKILQSGEISTIETNVVYRAEVEAGAFIYEAGTESMLRHRPMIELTDEQTSDDEVVAAYSIAVMKDGTKSFEVMRRSEINKVREKSQTGATRDRKGQPRKSSGPWVDWFGEMARKTVMRRHSKVLPMSGDILDAVTADEELYARSTERVLGAVDEDGPTILPSREEIAQDNDTTPHDPETGEIDEETARALDREAFAQAEGRADEDHGDQHDGAGEQAEAEPAREEHSPKAAFTKRLIDALGSAEDKDAIKSVDDEFVKHRAAMDEADVALVEGELRNARRRLRDGEGE